MKLKLSLIFLILIALSGGLFLINKKDSPKGESSNVDNSNQPVSTDTATTSQNGGTTIKDNKTDPQPAVDNSSILKIMPDLNKKWVIPQSFNQETREVLERRIADLNKVLKADYDKYDKWVDLGILRKLVGDYEEARNIWEFASIVWPDSVVAFHNLGDLYHFYLNDYKKAEVNKLQVIKLDPNYIPEYGLIYDLYKRMYGIGDSRTVGILLKGLNVNPQSVDLMILTAGHYREVKDTANARKYFEMALVRAKALNNSNLQKLIEDDLRSL